MIPLAIPYFSNKNLEQYTADIETIYNSSFLSKIFDTLNIDNQDHRTEFEEFLKSISVSYLCAKDMNSKRVQPNKQKQLFKNYRTALEQTKKCYREIQNQNPANSNFNKALREKVLSLENNAVKQMFFPYIYFSENEEEMQGGISIDLFDEFIQMLIEITQEAPGFIGAHDKANLEKDFILWWLSRISLTWSKFTSVPFTLGDWYTKEELNAEKGKYNSLCLDVLYDLLHAVDKKITRADIETAMRKFKKL